MKSQLFQFVVLIGIFFVSFARIDGVRVFAYEPQIIVGDAALPEVALPEYVTESDIEKSLPNGRLPLAKGELAGNGNVAERVKNAIRFAADDARDAARELQSFAAKFVKNDSDAPTASADIVTLTNRAARDFLASVVARADQFAEDVKTSDGARAALTSQTIDNVRVMTLRASFADLITPQVTVGEVMVPDLSVPQFLTEPVEPRDEIPPSDEYRSTPLNEGRIVNEGRIAFLDRVRDSLVRLIAGQRLTTRPASPAPAAPVTPRAESITIPQTVLPTVVRVPEFVSESSFRAVPPPVAPAPREVVIVEKYAAPASPELAPVATNFSAQLGGIAQALQTLAAQRNADRSELMKMISDTNNIGRLPSVTLSAPTISGTVSGLGDDSIPNDISIASTKDITTTGVFTSSAASGTSTLSANFAAGTTTISGVIRVNGTGATSTFAANVDVSGNLRIGGTCISCGGVSTIAGWTDSGILVELQTTSDLVAIGTSTPASGAVLTVEATSTGAIPLALRGYTGQAADFFRVLNASGQRLMFVSSTGGIFASSTLQAATTTIYGNLGVGTTTPVEQLSVAGRLYVGGTGTSTFENNLQVLGQLKIGTSSAYITDTQITGTSNFTISTQGESNHLVLQTLGRIGVVSTTPWGVFSVEHNGANQNMPVFVIADEGTSTPTMVVDWAGRIMAGTSTPRGWFTINDRGGADTFVVGSNTPHFIVKGGGNVGIGTSSPYALLSVNGAAALGTTTLYGSLTLGPMSSDPSTGTNGQIYYSTTDNSFRAYTNNEWSLLGGGGFSRDNTGIVRLTNLSDRLTIGTTSPAGLSLITAEATSTAAIPLTLRGYTAQTANLLQIQNSGSANLLYVNSSGGIFASSTLQVTGNSLLYGSLGIATTSPAQAFAVHGNALISGNITSVANVTATGTLTTANLAASASSTIDGLYVRNATTTYATTTDLVVTGRLLANTASSTITNLTTTNATATILTVSDIASTSRLVVSTPVTVNGSGTSTYAGGISAYGLASANGLTLTGGAVTGDNILATFGTTTLTNLAVTNMSTSTFAGGLAVQTNRLVVSQVTGSVGVGTTTPAADFAIQGNLLISGNITSVANVTATGTLTTANLAASASSTIDGLYVRNATTTYATTTMLAVQDLASTSRLTVSSSFTSTVSGTSTFAGGVSTAGLASSNGLTLSGGALLASSALGIFQQLGIGTTSPALTLGVQGNLLLSGDLSLANLTATGTVTSVNLAVSASSTLHALYAELATTTYATTTNLVVTGRILANTASSTITNLTTTNATATILTVSDIASTSRLVVSTPVTVNGAGTSTYAGGISAYGLASANGLTLTGGAVTGDGILATFGTTTLTNLAVTNTSTSTFAGGLTIQTNRLVVSQVTGSVGVGTTTPAADFAIQGNLLISGNITSVANVTATGTLTQNAFAYTALTAGTEKSDVNLNLARTVEFSAGALATQRAVLISAPTYAFTASSTLTDAATLLITGAPIAGAFNLATSTYALKIDGATSVDGATTLIPTNAYSLYIAPPTGATNNYSLIITGGASGFGTTSPAATLAVQGNALISGNITSVANVTATGTLTTANLAASASSTIDGLYVRVATTTYATTTDLVVTGRFLANTASSTITNLTTTNATATVLTVSSIASTSALVISTAFTSNAAGTSTFAGGVSTAGLASSNGLTLTGGAVTGDGILATFGTTTLTNLAVTNMSTSTFAGGLTIQTNRLVVSQVTGSVGVGTTTPAADFAIQGNLLISGNITSVANVTATGTVTTANLAASASSTIDGLYIRNATTTYATTTMFAVTDLASTSRLTVSSSFTSTVSGTSTFAGAISTAGLASSNGLTLSGGALLASSALGIFQQLGIGTTSPYARLSITGASGSTQPLFVVASSSNATEYFSISSTGTTTIQTLQTGAMTFESNAGAVTWVDLPVTSSAAQQTAESYSAQLDTNDVLTIYGESDGLGGIWRPSVGIGTSTPWGIFSIEHGSIPTSSPVFVIADQGTSSPSFVVMNTNGFVGVATATPGSRFSVHGNALVSNNLLTANLTATGTVTTANLAASASSTIDGLYVRNATTTYATTTDLVVTGRLLANTASSTITNLTTTNATATVLAVTDLASTSRLVVSSNSATSTFAWGIRANLLNITSASATSTFTSGLSAGGLSTSEGLTITGGAISSNSTATSSLAGGIDITSGCFSINNTCVGSGSGTVNSGTTGQLTFYASDAATVSGTSTIFISTGSLVGIGTTSPWAKLSVQGIANGTGPVFAVGTSTENANLSALMVSASGKVGIGGTTTPMDALSVRGNIANTLETSGTNPTLVGSTSINTGPTSVYVSGRYAYVANQIANTLQKFDISTSSPALTGQANTGTSPTSVYVSGRYAYVVNTSVGTLQKFDISTSSPALTGQANTDSSPQSVYVSGGYAYVVTDGTTDTLQIFDISTSSPALTGQANTDSGPTSVYVSGRYAYVVTDGTTDTLQIFDISTSSPALTGQANTGTSPTSVYVSGRYAYVTNQAANTLQKFDISTSSPALVGQANGTDPRSVYVSGRYAYVANLGGDTVQVFDVFDSSSLNVVGSVATGDQPRSIFVSGHYAYVINYGSNSINVFDISGIETTSAIVHSLEAGNLQVRNDIIGQGQLQIYGGVNIGAGGLYSSGALSVNATSTFLGITAGGLEIDRGGLCVDNDGECTASTSGRISAVSYVTGASDLAENYYSDEALQPGDAVVSLGGVLVARSARIGDKRALGVVSTQPGIILGMDNDGANQNLYPIALTGRVPVKINLQGGPIEVGDPITVSSELGVAMKATTTSMVLGYALEAFYGATTTVDQGSPSTQPSPEASAGTAGSGTRMILMFAKVGQWNAPRPSPEASAGTAAWDSSNVLMQAVTDATAYVAQAVSAMKDWLTSMGVVIEQSVIRVKEIVVDMLTAKKVAVDQLQMKDKFTGEAYCVELVNGDLVRTKGECAEPNTTVNSIPTPDSASSPQADASAPLSTSQSASLVDSGSATTATTGETATTTAETATVTEESAATTTPETQPTPEAPASAEAPVGESVATSTEEIASSTQETQ